MNDFLTIALLTATLRMTTPLLFTAMGGLLSERSGVINIALEGLMLIGAFGAAVGTYYTGNSLLGLAIGLGASGLAATVHAIWCITLKGDQVVAGTAINIFGLSVPAFLLQRLFSQSGRSPTVEQLPRFTSSLSILVPFAFLLVPVIWYLLFRTRSGLRVMAAGEYPGAAESVGISVAKYRYAAVIASGLLAGLGGASLSIGDLSFFTTNITQGRGFIALAAVIFGNWSPLGTLAATLLFGAAQAIQIQSQALGLPISQDLLVALPYLLTLLAIAGLLRNSRPPAGLGRHARS